MFKGIAVKEVECKKKLIIHNCIVIRRLFNIYDITEFRENIIVLCKTRNYLKKSPIFI